MPTAVTSEARLAVLKTQAISHSTSLGIKLRRGVLVYLPLPRPHADKVPAPSACNHEQSLRGIPVRQVRGGYYVDSPLPRTPKYEEM